MNLPLIFALFLVTSMTSLLASAAVLPETLELDDGTTYSEVRLMSQTPSEVVFMHSGGAKNLEKSKLPASLQKAFNFSAEAAEQYDSEQAALLQERRQKAQALADAREEAKALKAYIKKNTFMLRGRIQQITPEGILIEFQEPSKRYTYFDIPISVSEEDSRIRYKSYRKARPRREFGWLFLTGHPRQEEFSSGQQIDVNAYLKGTHTLGDITAKNYIFLDDQ
ncbi:MAG: hypothetical protein ACSHYA_12300 [Opitutaceae bacterium]